MEYMIKVSVLLVALIAIVSSQSPRTTRRPLLRPPASKLLQLNANRLSNPFAPPGGLVPVSPGGFGQTYCPLTLQEAFKDPSILDATEAQVAQAMQRAQGRLSPDQKLFLSAKRSQSAARNARRSADGRRGGPGVAPPRGGAGGPPRGGPARGSPGRTKRQAADIAVLAPTDKKSVCRSVEKKVQSVMSEDGHICYLFSEDEVNYWDCATTHASFPRADLQFQRYYCEPDNYVYQSVLSFCPDPDDVRWVTMYIPISCCTKHYSCDFTPYSSASGPKRFPQ